MILANWQRREIEEPHSSIVPNLRVEGLFLPWSVSMSSDVPYRIGLELGSGESHVVKQKEKGLTKCL
jgi:hypothetical protein